jgi:hypothetical protein
MDMDMDVWCALQREYWRSLLEWPLVEEKILGAENMKTQIFLLCFTCSCSACLARGVWMGDLKVEGKESGLALW